MKSVQSIILGEPDKDKPTAVPPVAKEEVKPVVQPSSAIMSDPVVSAPDDAGPDEYPSRDALPRDESQGKKSQEQITQQSNGAQSPKQATSLTDVVDAMYKSRMPTEEELKKEQKRERAKSIIAAIADGTSAIANLYFAGKGAKNVEQTSMSAANAKRYQNILDKRMKMQEKWDDARLSAYDRDRGYNYQKDRDDANWKRSGEWHDSQVKTDNERYADNQARNKVLDEFNMTDRDRNYELSKISQENQEKAQKDASAYRWASYGLQKKAQEEHAKSAGRGGKKTDKEVKHPKLRYDGPNGATKYYDLNDDVQVAKMYNEGLKSGYFKEKEGKQPTVKQMRDMIVGSTGRWKEGNSANLDGAGTGWSLNSNGTGSWSLK